MAMKMPKSDPATVRRFEALARNDPRLQLRKMFGHPAAFVNGRMCFGTFGAELFVRLSDADRREAERWPATRAFAPMAGRPMTGYWVLPPEVWEDPKLSKEWVERAIAHTSRLPKKPPKVTGAR
jgi:TfoX/Sxy family transcriptional regulator of competence genes